MNSNKIEREIYTTFAEITANMGYSEIHGRILAALLVAGKPLSLTELAHKIGVSVPAVSLSLDLLETLGMARRIKMPGDRNLYVQLTGDLVAGLRTAFVAKADRTIENTLARFTTYRKQIKSKDGLLRTLDKLEHEARRLKRYIGILAKAPL
jgi:DNA-binding transcriptional regulator GbsR (MarR family)